MVNFSEKAYSLVQYLFAKHGASTTFTVILYLLIEYHEHIPAPILVTLLGMMVSVYTNLIKAGLEEIQLNLDTLTNFALIVKQSGSELFEKARDLVTDMDKTKLLFFPKKRSGEPNGNPPPNQQQASQSEK